MRKHLNLNTFSVLFFVLGSVFWLNGCNHRMYGGINDCGEGPKKAEVVTKVILVDSDGDGVPDNKDRCPNTPRNCRVDANGCPIDSDQDGVCDGVDRCPNTPKSCRVDANGCPIDSDQDGVCDGADRCPNTPADRKVDAVGCPISKLIPEPDKPVVLQGVNFEFNKSSLTEDSKDILDEVAASLKERPDVKVEIGGHCDSIGPQAYNQTLSQARAETVMQYLVDKGVKAENLRAEGYGESQPIASNKTEAGRAQNRRVELKRIQ
jgi:OOP family OmpA-OmpF porin